MPVFGHDVQLHPMAGCEFGAVLEYVTVEVLENTRDRDLFHVEEMAGPRKNYETAPHVVCKLARCVVGFKLKLLHARCTKPMQQYSVLYTHDKTIFVRPK